MNFNAKFTYNQFIGLLILYQLTSLVYSKPIPFNSESDENNSLQVPVKHPKVVKPKGSTLADALWREPNDAFFSFLKKVLDTAHLSTKSAVKRAKTAADSTKPISAQLDQLLTNQIEVATF